MKYPIYIPSKGRADNQKTVQLLESQGITNYKVVIEKNDYGNYGQYLSSKNTLVLPSSNYGTVTVARNYAIEHSKRMGYKKHWQLDDDIGKIYLHNKGKVMHTDINKIFSDIENTLEKKQLSPILLAGLTTSASFLASKTKDYTLNTSLTSCVLITNTPLRFRIKMLEDTDYQLRILKQGDSILKFNNYAFAYTTQLKQIGGYTSIYNDTAKRMEGLKEFLDLYPEVSPEIIKKPNGMLKIKNIRFVWAKYKKNNQILLKHL